MFFLHYFSLSAEFEKKIPLPHIFGVKIIQSAHTLATEIINNL